MMKTYRLVLMLIVLLTGVATVNAQGGDADSFFTLHGSDPVIEREPGTWKNSFNEPGAVVYHDGQFHLFRTGYEGWPRPSGIGYLTSEDGLNWTDMSEEPVFHTNDVEYAGQSIGASSVLVEDDGTWVLYFYIYDSGAWPMPGGKIGRATASDPLGPWTADAEPVLLPGGAGAWDEGQVGHPSVVRTEDGYIMYYSGFDVDRRRSVGMATSDDGINWVKSDDPATPDVPYAESDPVLSGDFADWDVGTAWIPRVTLAPEGFVMFYRGVSRGIGVATSEDGINWTKYTANPIITAELIGGRVQTVGYNTLLFHDGTYYLYLEAGSGSTSIYVATFEGDALPLES